MRRRSRQPIDLEIDAHLERRRVDDAAQPADDGAVGAKHLAHVGTARRRFDPPASVRAGQIETQRPTPVGAGAESTDDAAPSQRVVGRVEVEIAVQLTSRFACQRDRLATGRTPAPRVDPPTTVRSENPSCQRQRIISSPTHTSMISRFSAFGSLITL